MWNRTSSSSVLFVCTLLSAGCGSSSEGSSDGNDSAGKATTAGSANSEHSGGAGGRDTPRSTSNAGHGGASNAEGGSHSSTSSAGHGGASNAEGGSSSSTAEGGTSSGTNGAAGSSSRRGDGGGAGTGATDVVAEGCGLLCSHADECAEDSEAACLVRCGILGSNEECTDEYAAFAGCMETAEFSCNEDGLVSVIGCEGTAAAATACILGIEPDPTIVGPCESYCDQVVAAECENTEGYQSCVNGCTLFGADDFPCSTQWDDVLTCADGKTFECGDNGKAVASGCDAQVLVFGVCVLFNPETGS